MQSKWGSALAAACTSVALLCSPSAIAQVEWLTTLNTAATAAALTQQNVVASSDGSIYATGFADDGDGTRVRLSRISASGVVQWVRWASGSYYSLASQLPLLTHSDNSASIVYQDSNSSVCIENFSVAGESRYRQCGYNSSDARVTLAPDSDLFVAFGNQRNLKKVSPTGLLRWSRTEPLYLSGALFAAGVDSSGNYYEIQSNRLRSWGSADGNLLNDVLLSGFSWNGYTQHDRPVASRSARDVVVVRDVAILSNAVVASVARYGVTGAFTWTRNVVFPGYGGSDIVTVVPADSDSVYIVRTPSADGDSQVAKISASGAVLWQRHYSRARRIVETATGLLAIRSDVSTASGSNDSFIFAINAADGTLGSPTIYSRSDLFAPSDWFAVANGVVAIFQGNNPFAPYSGYSTVLGATSVFVGSLVANRWVVVAEKRPAASVAQSDCLMPRLANSSPASWWGRTQKSAPISESDWTTVATLSGVVQARTSASATGCGAPIVADGGRVIASPYSDRVKKIDTAGATVWQASSSTFPVQYASQALESVASNGEVTYVLGSLVGRVSASGSILFEAETNRPNPRYVAVDSANNAWLMSGSVSSEGYVSKVSPTGAVLWSILIDTVSCSDGVMSALLTASNEMLVATQSCGEGRVFKVNASGQIVWQRIVSGTALRPYVMLNALRTDSTGNIYAGGCASNGSPASSGANAVSVLASWSSVGSERWTAQGDLMGGASECITSIATDSSGNVYAASSSSVATRAPVLWSLTSAGIERWRNSGVLSSPFSTMTELASDSTDKLIALGEAPPSTRGSREVTLRRINVATLGSTLRLKFLEVPAALIGYREQFPVRIGLRTAADVATTATADTVVGLGLQTGTGNLDGSLTCTIVTGSSECTIVDTRYDVVESGVTLTAGSDGFATVISPAAGFRKADTSTVISALSTAPYNAFSVVRVRAAVQGPPPPANQGVGGSLSGPSSSGNPGTYNCAYTNAANTLPSIECDLLVYSAAMPLNAQFYSSDNRYNGSTAIGFSLPVSKVLPTLLVTNDPGNSYVGGDRIRFRVAVMTAGGFNASQFTTASSVTIVGGSCAGLVIAGNTTDKFAGSYRLCEIAQVPAGPLNVNIAFIGSDDLLPSAAATQTITINLGAVFRGFGSFPTTVTVCSPTPGVTCGIDNSYGGNWQCVGPVGMSGQVFFVPTTSGNSFIFPGSPINFSNVNGLQNWPTGIDWTFQSSSCKLDVDGDGAVMGMTDGVLILRRMLGLSGTALTQNASNICAPLSPAGIASAITLSSYDLDGDGSVRPETDGLLLLRALLGFRGTALATGATGAAATRQTGDAIVNYLRNNCAFPLRP